MVKLSLQGLTHWYGQAMDLEQIAVLLENPSLCDGLSSEKVREIQTKGLFYILEFNIPDEESIAFVRSFLFENPTNQYKNDLIHFLIHKNALGNTAATTLLFDFLLSHPDPELINILTEISVNPVSPQHKTLFALYQNDRTAFFQSEKPLETLTAFFIDASRNLRHYLIQKAETNQLDNWVMLTKAVFNDTKQDYENLLVNFEKFSAEEKALTSYFLTPFIKTHSGVKEIIFQLYNNYQTDALLSLITENKLQPQTPEEYALFLLFTHQWEAYDRFDFDNTYLKRAFLKASPGQRQKILSQSRKSGKFNWLHELSDFRKTKWVSDLNETDWENILARLITEKNDIDLLRILKIVPPIQAKTIIKTIQSSADNLFEFSNDEDWKTLSSFVNRLPSHLPAPLEINHTKTLANPVLSSETQNHFKEVLLGTSTNLVHKVNLETLKPILPAFNSPAPQIRQILLTKDQNHLILAHGDHQIRIIRLQDDQVIKVFSGHEGFIKKMLLSKDQKTLFSTGFDGKLIAWRFPLGPVIQSHQISTQECFDMQFSAGQKSGIIADAQGIIRIFDPVSLKTVRTYQASASSLTSLAASIKTSQIAVYDTSETLSVWNLESGQQISTAQGIPSPITSLAYSDHDDFLIAGHLSGTLTFYSSLTIQPLVSISIHDQPLINFHKLDNHRLLLVFRDGFLSIIDFLLLNTLYTPINLIKTEIEFSEPSGVWGNFVNAFFRFIHRFDILIDEEAGIQIGEYDIQIE